MRGNALGHLGDKRVEGCAVGEVALIAVEPPAERGHSGADLASVRLESGGDTDDVRARAPESEGSPAPDPAPTAGHERSPAREVEGVRKADDAFTCGSRRGSSLLAARRAARRRPRAPARAARQR